MQGGSLELTQAAPEGMRRRRDLRHIVILQCPLQAMQAFRRAVAEQSQQCLQPIMAALDHR